MNNVYLLAGGLFSISLVAFLFGLTENQKLEYFSAGIYLLLMSIFIAIFGVLTEILNVLEVAK